MSRKRAEKTPRDEHDHDLANCGDPEEWMIALRDNPKLVFSSKDFDLEDLEDLGLQFGKLDIEGNRNRARRERHGRQVRMTDAELRRRTALEYQKSIVDRTAAPDEAWLYNTLSELDDIYSGKGRLLGLMAAIQQNHGLGATIFEDILRLSGGSDSLTKENLIYLQRVIFKSIHAQAEMPPDEKIKQWIDILSIIHRIVSASTSRVNDVGFGLYRFLCYAYAYTSDGKNSLAKKYLANVFEQVQNWDEPLVYILKMFCFASHDRTNRGNLANVRCLYDAILRKGIINAETYGHRLLFRAVRLACKNCRDGDWKLESILESLDDFWRRNNCYASPENNRDNVNSYLIRFVSYMVDNHNAYTRGKMLATLLGFMVAINVKFLPLVLQNALENGNVTFIKQTVLDYAFIHVCTRGNAATTSEETRQKYIAVGIQIMEDYELLTPNVENYDPETQQAVKQLFGGNAQMRAVIHTKLEEQASHLQEVTGVERDPNTVTRVFNQYIQHFTNDN